jgi:hypothetical protein
LDLPPERRREVDLRFVPRMLERLVALDPAPLTRARPAERRLIGNCRDSAVLLCALLRHQGRPARPRAGFATYLEPDFFTDHWVCEVWCEDEPGGSGAAPETGRWVVVDPGFLPDPGKARFDFDTLDVPADRFLNAGRAWQRCRRGGAEPVHFGLPGRADNGLGWIGSQVVRDLAALNKWELLPWDSWGLGHSVFAGYSADDIRLLDRIAGITTSGDNDAFELMRRLYREDSRLPVPSTVHTLDHAAGGRPAEAILSG